MRAVLLGNLREDFGQTHIERPELKSELRNARKREQTKEMSGFLLPISSDSVLRLGEL